MIHQDPKPTAEYTADRIPGRITIRCSNDSHVIVEQLHLSRPMQADAALALATGELPEDAKQLYDHQHPGCRTLQYQSADLSKELGADDPPGVALIELEGGGATYDPNVVTTVLIDLLTHPGRTPKAARAVHEPRALRRPGRRIRSPRGRSPATGEVEGVQAEHRSTPAPTVAQVIEKVQVAIDQLEALMLSDAWDAVIDRNVARPVGPCAPAALGA